MTDELIADLERGRLLAITSGRAAVPKRWAPDPELRYDGAPEERRLGNGLSRSRKVAYGWSFRRDHFEAARDGEWPGNGR